MGFPPTIGSGRSCNLSSADTDDKLGCFGLESGIIEGQYLRSYLRLPNTKNL